MSVTEAEHTAADAVEKLKAVLAAGDTAFWSFPGDVAYWRVSDNKVQDEFIPGLAFVYVTSVLRDGTTQTDKLKLTQHGDQWYITLSEEAMALKATPTIEGQPQSGTANGRPSIEPSRAKPE